jgi:hypothetical protein
MPRRCHDILSVVLLIVSFTVSTLEVNVLNALVSFVTMCLTGCWHQQRIQVQAGNCFAVTSVAIMVVQYALRFRVWDGILDRRALEPLGMEWTEKQVVRHFSILVLCLLQKQLWFRWSKWFKSQPEETRDGQYKLYLKCPPWLHQHHDVCGIAALLVVAVARCHLWSHVLSTTAVLWFVFGDPVPKQFARVWLWSCRGIIAIVLVIQVLMALAKKSYGWDGALDYYFKTVCAGWRRDVNMCLSQWKMYVMGDEGIGIHFLWLWEFLALFFLAFVEQLMDNSWMEAPGTDGIGNRALSKQSLNKYGTAEISSPDASEKDKGEDGSSTPASIGILTDQLSASPKLDEDCRKRPQRRWMVVAHWWPCLTMLLIFVNSLSGGTFVGVSHLIALLMFYAEIDGILRRRLKIVQRVRLLAMFFLALGLIIQSPLLPCSQALCSDGVHQIFLARDICAVQEELQESSFATWRSSSENEGKCEYAPLGRGTLATLFMDVVGLRRLKNLGIDALLFGQLSSLFLLVMVATIQLRIYRHPDYVAVDAFVMENPAILRARATRYVQDFHCACMLEKQRSRNRQMSSQTKFDQTSKKIDHILEFFADQTKKQADKRSVESSNCQSSRTLNNLEDAQIDFGLPKSIAKRIFFSRVNKDNPEEVGLGLNRSQGEEYLDLLCKVALGVINSDTANKRALRLLASLEFPDGTSTHPSLNFSCAAAQSVLQRIICWWTRVKTGRLVAACMMDYAFLGVNEVDFEVYSPDYIIYKEQLHDHRKDNDPFRILWKLVISNLQFVLLLISTFAFMDTRSVLDMIRLFVVIFWLLRAYPFPPHKLWVALKVYSIGLLLARTIYDMPWFCSGPSRRGFDWNDDTVHFCSMPRQDLGADAIIGLAKRRGMSALSQSTWLTVVWADHLCVAVIIIHQWMLTRSGLWHNVIYDNATKRVWLSTSAADVESAGLDVPAERERASSRHHFLSKVDGDISETVCPRRREALSPSGAGPEDEHVHRFYLRCFKQLRFKYIWNFEQQQERRQEAEQAAAEREPHVESVTPTESSSHILGLEPLMDSVAAYTSAKREHLLEHIWRYVDVDNDENRGRSQSTVTRDSADEEIFEYLLNSAAARKIQRSVRRWFMIRCDMGHPLVSEGSTRLKWDARRRTAVVCATCDKRIEQDVAAWCCSECYGYRVCFKCHLSMELMAQACKHDDRLVSQESKAGVQLYTYHYVLGIALFVYVFLFNHNLSADPGQQSTFKAINESSLSVRAVLWLSLHISLVMIDRVFFRMHYQRLSSHSAQLLMYAQLLYLAFFFFVCVSFVISAGVDLRLQKGREFRMALYDQPALCGYYIVATIYLALHILQHKFGLPSVYHDSLRPTRLANEDDWIMESIGNGMHLLHYYLPFVDDIRVI